MIASIKEALDDGDMDEEDKALLLSICPPLPKEDWAAILKLLEEHHGYIKTGEEDSSPIPSAATPPPLPPRSEPALPS